MSISCLLTTFLLSNKKKEEEKKKTFFYELAERIESASADKRFIAQVI